MAAALVIAWWGPNLVVLGPGGRCARYSLTGGRAALGEICQLVATEFPGAASALLLYQPDSLALHEVTCPPAARPHLRKILADEFPALHTRTAVWAAAPLRATRDGFRTVLYLEAESSLPGLRAALARRGVRLEGAWPLAALWEAAAATSDDGRGFLGIAALPERILVYCLSPGGDRSIRIHAGARAAELAAADLRHCLARFEETERPRACVAIEDFPNVENFREAFADCRCEEITTASWLSRARGLVPGDLSDLLPDRALIRIGPRQCQIAAALGLMLLATAAWWAARGWQERAAAEGARALARADAARVEENVSAREFLRERIDQLRGAQQAATPAAPRHYAFLVALARGCPPTVALRSLQIEGSDFEIRGRMTAESGGSAEALLHLRQALFTPTQPWRAAAPAEETARPDGEFVLRGSWMPESS